MLKRNCNCNAMSIMHNHTGIPIKCPFCETGTLTPTTYTGVFLGTTVEGLECNTCDTCDAEPIMTDQIKRNEIRIDAARCLPIDKPLCPKCLGHQTSTDGGNRPCKACGGSGFA